MKRRARRPAVLGGLVSLLLGAGYGVVSERPLADTIEPAAASAIREAGGKGVTADFAGPLGFTRHPVLRGGTRLSEDTRIAVARAVAAVPGVGGVGWAAPPQVRNSNIHHFEPLHCQQDVEGLLRTRSIRFEEASAALLPASRILLDEVAEALEPCAGSIIAITGHTDRSGTEPDNVALSLERARVVREALVARGIPRVDLRAQGVGSDEPVTGLAPEDPANRRIEFSVIRKRPLEPTPIDTPGAL